jgi:hypothetical protein
MPKQPHRPRTEVINEVTEQPYDFAEDSGHAG